MIDRRTFLVALFTLGIALAAVAAISLRGEPVVVSDNLGKLPMSIAGFAGRNDHFPASVYQALNADKNLYRHYVSAAGRKVDLYIGYYGTAKGGRSEHNPHGCLPGAGWAILQSNKATLHPADAPRGVQVNYILARKEGIYTVMYYWYQSLGTRVISSGIAQNLHRFIGRIFYNRDDGAFVQVTAMVNEPGIDRAKTASKQFAARVVALLPHYWPQEK